MVFLSVGGSVRKYATLTLALTYYSITNILNSTCHNAVGYMYIVNPSSAFFTPIKW